MDAFTHYSDILRAQVICAMRRTKVIIRLFKIYLAFGIFPYFPTVRSTNQLSGKSIGAPSPFACLFSLPYY